MLDNHQLIQSLQNTFTLSITIYKLCIKCQHGAMDRDNEFVKVLAVFAHYGFRKASMEDLAQAAEVSRQTLYKRFKTKESVLDWAVEGCIKATHQQVSIELNNQSASAAECLVNAFGRWVGDIVPLLRDSPHGSEIMDLGMESVKRTGSDFHAQFEAELAQFLLDRKICETSTEAENIAFLLHMSSKGLLLKSATRDEYQAGMSRVINTVTAVLNS